MKNKQDLRVKRTHRLLAESLLKLMKKMPFEKITITDICENAMVHRTTFYTHFEDKYDLLKFALSELEKPFEEENIRTKNEEGYLDFFMEAAQSILTYIDRHIDLLRIFIKKNKEDSFVSMLRSALTERLAERLTQMEEEGVSLPAPGQVLANWYAGGCLNMLLWWIENDMPCSSEQLFQYFALLIRPAHPISFLNTKELQ